MEDELLPELAALQLKFPDVSNPDVNSRSNENGLSDWQRFVAKNFFDSQPERRRAYFKRLHYELGKDGESYRPEDSDAAFRPIEEDNMLGGDPGLSGYFQPGGGSEFFKDLKDVGFDFLVEAPMVAAEATAGTAVGAGLGSGLGKVGAATGALSGGTVGASLGKAHAEVLKRGIGDFFLDKSVPLDLQEVVYQSAVTGVTAGLTKGAGNMVKNWKRLKAADLQKTLKEIAVRKSNGTWNDELATNFAQNPEKYTPENVKGATKRLMEFADSIFGTSAENPKSTRDLRGGVAKSAISPLNDRADLEIQKLATDPEANFLVDEIIGTIQERVGPLKAKKFRTMEEDKALDFLSKEVERLKKKTKIESTPSLLVDADGRHLGGGEVGYRELNFKEGRDFLKRLQNAAYEKGSPVEGSRAMVAATRGLKELSDVKAGSLGSDLPKINAKRSEILNTYKNMQAMIKDGTIQSSYVGKDSVAKTRVRAMFEEADRVLGTHLSDGAESLQYQSAVERLYDAPASFGSGAVLGDAMRQGLKEAPKQAFGYGTVAAVPVGMGVLPAKTIPIAAGVGAVKGFAQGFKEGATFSSPDNLVKGFSKVKTRLDELNRNPTIARDILSRTLSPPNLGATQVGPITSGQGPLAPPPVAAQPQAAAPVVGPPAPEPTELLPELQNLQLKFPPGFEEEKTQP